MTKRLVLVGGGHAHLFVLQKLASAKLSNLEVTLISPSEWQDYSGMVPGWMAGYYSTDECRVDLRPLAERANANFIIDYMVGMDANRQCVCLSDGRHIEYDFLSLDIGSEVDIEWLSNLGDKLITIKPFEYFRLSWRTVMQECENNPNFKLTIVGGGAAGVELAFSAKYALKNFATNVQVSLVSGKHGLLADHNRSVRARVLSNLKAAKINLINQRAVGTTDGLILSNGALVESNKVIAATGARPAIWLRLSKLLLDANGYVLVDARHCSLSHSNVFAAGNVCSRSDITLARSGVHAVRAGPVLAINLIRALTSGSLQEYRPRKQSLYLLSCGDKRAIASWGSLSAEGRWIWYWKDILDKRFISSFQ